MDNQMEQGKELTGGERQEQQADIKVYQMTGKRISGYLQSILIPSEVKIQCSQVDVVTRFSRKKVRESHFSVNDISQIQFGTRPILRISDVIRFAIFGILLPVSYGLSAFAILLFLYLTFSRHMLIKLNNGMTVAVPIRQDADAIPFLEEISYPGSRIESIRATQKTESAIDFKEGAIIFILLILAAVTLPFGMKSFLENMEKKVEKREQTQQQDMGNVPQTSFQDEQGAMAGQVLYFNLTVMNNTGIDIYGLYASTMDADDWEEDILGESILYAGDSVGITFEVDSNSLDWDFAVVDEYGNSLEFYGLSFENCNADGATLVLEYDGEQGTATLY